MGQQAGYLVDLNTVKLEEHDGTFTSWIQGMTVGKYMHPVHGVIDLSMERIRRFAENVKNNVRGQELDIDYDHKERTSEAAGWVKGAEARSDGLWLLVEWTSEAAAKIKSKAYRYFSPEFDDEWTHPKTQQKFQDVLFGGGITNRPFLKDILPINLSEAFALGEQVNNHQGGQMDPKKLRELLGLSEDATDEQVMTALTEKLASGNQEENPSGGDNKGGAAGVAQLSEEVIRLAESSPAIKALMDKAAAQEKELGEVRVNLRLSEVAGQVTQLNETATSKGRALPTTTQDALKALLVKAPKQFGDEVLEIVKTLSETGFVQLGEIGQQHEGGELDAEKAFNDEVAKLTSGDKPLSYVDAVEQVARTHPKLFTDYQNAAYAFRA